MVICDIMPSLHQRWPIVHTQCHAQSGAMTLGMDKWSSLGPPTCGGECLASAFTSLACPQDGKARHASTRSSPFPPRLSTGATDEISPNELYNHRGIPVAGKGEKQMSMGTVITSSCPVRTTAVPLSCWYMALAACVSSILQPTCPPSPCPWQTCPIRHSVREG